MAIVWRARDLRLQRPVAVKILRPELAEDADLARRFASEAQHAASLAHQNVAAVYDTDVDGDRQFIVMELVDGPSVADLLREQGALEPNVAVEIAAAAARALGAAHRRGLIHRDVKPANLLIGRDGRTRLADFGIARALTVSRVTTAGTVLGSVPYLSPEQARGEEATASGDIFSLGVVLFEMLTGQLPWDADTPAAMATVRLHAPAPAPSRIVRSLPAGLDAIVGRALAVDPTERYPSARVLADALEGWIRRHRGTRGARAALRGAATAVATGLSPAPATSARSVAAAGPMTASRGVVRRAEPGAAIVGTARPNPDARVPGGASATRRGGRPRTESTAPPVGGDDRPRRVELLLAALAMVLPLVVVAGLLLNDGSSKDGEGAPGPVVVTTPFPTTVPVASASPAPSATVVPGPTAPATAVPTPEPTRTPTVTPPPTPEPPRPTDPVAPPEPTGDGPSRAVRAFYTSVEDHDWQRAIALWSPSMQERYPPDEWLIDRFRPTTRIDITQLDTVSTDRDAGRARVSVTVVEHRRDDPSPRTFAGAWDLVRIDGRWVLDDPHF